MKIVVITGSPRKGGNSFAMTDAFVREAEKLGHEVKRFDAAFMKIGGCHACMTCFKTGKACSFDDDFNLIAPAILEADAVVFTMPTYWYSIPAQIKGVIDRVYSFVVGGKDIAGKKIAISGFGNVAWGAATKATQLGAHVIAISGPDGAIYDPEGMNDEKIAYMLELRRSNNDVVAPFADRFPSATFYPGKKAWSIKCDIAMPCAFQNELTGDDAKELIANGTWCCAEVSNMGCTPEAIAEFQKNRIMFAPGKAVNAGGVATSGLEMTQNAMHISWSAEEVDKKLHEIMANIHHACVEHGKQDDGYINYVKGANVAGFMKVATAMLEQGVI